ncbi:MAG: IclR family transcriptional regulator [Desulfobacterales bacterium]|nr:MAG: IclR family transcriptional regulator [Desulfobacterales bacterium]
MNKKDKKTTKESKRQVEAVAKALDILECFTGSEPELSLKQLSEKTGLYKSRILRLCGTLVAQNFLIRTPASSYKLGPKLMALGKVYENTNPLVSVARPVLRELALLTGESTKLFVVDGTKRLCLVREKGTYPLRYAVSEGETYELHAGAGGKVLLAYASEEFRHQILKNNLKKITPATIVERDRLEKEFESIRKQGYAFSRGELVPEVAGMAAPVFDHENSICGAMAVAGAEQRFTAVRQKDMLKNLLASAQKLSCLLGNVG